MYVDPTNEDVEHLRLMRNRAGEYMSNREFAKCFEAILDIKRDVKARKLPPNTFENLLEEVIGIGHNLTDDPMIIVEFGTYIAKHQGRLSAV